MICYFYVNLISVIPLIYYLYSPCLHYIEQGTVCLGLRSATHVVLGALKKAPNDLAAYQKKLQRIDDHMAVGMSGLTADGRSLVKYVFLRIRVNSENCL